MSRVIVSVRHGVTLERAMALVKDRVYGDPPHAAPLLRLTIDKEGYNTLGNRVSHYHVDLTWPPRVLGPTFTVTASGRQRREVGYSGVHEHALYVLEKLGWKVDTGKAYKGMVSVLLPVTNWFEEKPSD